MRGINRMFVVGRLGQDPELRTSKAGNPWMRLSIATNRGVKQDEEWVEETDWHKVQVFGKTAEACMASLRKGSMVGIEGNMRYESWTDDEGVRRTTAKLYADRVHFLDPKDKQEVAEA